MMTKPAKPVHAPVPTCGEVFQFLIDALDLPAWADILDSGDPKNAKISDKGRAKRLSDQLRDWATEDGGRAPRRSDFEEFIRTHTSGLPARDTMALVLISMWRRVLDEHCDTVREQASCRERAETRSWYVRSRAPHALYFLYGLQKLLLRLSPGGGPTLGAPLDQLFGHFVDVGFCKHPLLKLCIAHYGQELPRESSAIDPKSLGAWRRGEERPSFSSLGRYFKGHPRLIEILLNFSFASLLENLVSVSRHHVLEADLADWQNLLRRQAQCMGRLDDRFAKEKAIAEGYNDVDYERYHVRCLGDYQQEIRWAVHELQRAPLDPRWLPYSVYPEYEARILGLDLPMEFRVFFPKFNVLWRSTCLSLPAPAWEAATLKLDALKRDHPETCRLMNGPILTIRARLALLCGFADNLCSFRNNLSRKSARAKTPRLFPLKKISQTSGEGRRRHSRPAQIKTGSAGD